MNIAQNAQLHTVDVCVIGGGMAGLTAAIAAARHGAKVLLMRDRPVLGGNASSEIRMTIRGAKGKENRESGILEEIELENIYRNPTMNYSVWDSVLYQMVIQEKNIELLLNCSCFDCTMEENRISSVTGWQLNSYTFHTVKAAIFMDCSGDSILANTTGAKYRTGRESRYEFDEYGAPETADRCTMGSTCLIQARETDHPCPFTPPEWAYVYPDDESMYFKDHHITRDSSTNFWWIELGGEQDTIGDAQAISEELIKVAYGVWDHIKNQDDHGMDNWELEWIGFLPGKRESRRYEGEYILTQRDLEEGTHFEDTVAYGGWTMDNHSPKGFRYVGYSSTHIKPKVPYEIPFRCLYSVNITNLMFAGRNISATHMAMSSTRVMATCAVMGQAAGTGAALAIEHGCNPCAVTKEHIHELQTALLEDGCMIPGLCRIPESTAELELPEAEKIILLNGWERPHNENLNTISIKDGSELVLALKKMGGTLRIALDPDYSRDSITSHSRYQKFAMRAHVFLNEPPLSMPKNLLKHVCITQIADDGTENRTIVSDNRKPRIFTNLQQNTVKVILSELTSWGGEEVRFFACDVTE